MHFTTLHFAIFFLITITVAWELRKFPAARKLFLVTASYYFYASWDWKLLGLLFLSTLWNWSFGEMIGHSSERVRKKVFLIFGLAGNIFLLGFFKYYEFFRDNFDEIARALGLATHLPLLEVLLPLGISYYTFQGIGYIVDIYKGKGKTAKSFLDFMLFMSFFPQLLIGPICRGHELLPQIEAEQETEIKDISYAVSLIFSGLFKKVILSTYLATNLVDNIFIAPENYSSLELLIAAYGYSIQLLMDFSGYTDIARGIGLLMGYKLPENFNNPYASTNIGEYWRRWHMSFSFWLRDYIYFTLGGSRAGKLRAYINIIITMLLGGLWHGAAWGFVIWGGIHGLALAGYKISLDIRRKLGKPIVAQTWIGKFFGWFVTFNLCVLARIVFRSADMDTAISYWHHLLEFSYRGRGFEIMAVVIILFGLGLNFFGNWIRKTFISFLEVLPKPVWPIVWVAIAILIMVFQPNEIAPYIYFKF